MRNGTVIVDRIPGVQDLEVLADLHLQGAADDEVQFLSDMGRKLDIGVARAVTVTAHDVQRVRDPVLEARRHVVVDHLVRFGDLLTVAGAGHGIGLQLRAAALDQVGHVDAELIGAAVKESEA